MQYFNRLTHQRLGGAGLAPTATITKKSLISIAALAAGLIVQTQGFAQAAVPSGTSVAAQAAVNPEAAAHKVWRSFVATNPAPQKGCFHISYPNFVWEGVDCRDTQLRGHSVPVHPAAETPDVVGDGNDYVVEARGLISDVEGDFYENDIGSVTSVGVAAFGGGGILGSNEYSLQLNTNSSSITSACKDKPGCTVWQQFVYATDSSGIEYIDVSAALYIQYWLIGWTASCPSGWQHYSDEGNSDCYKNSSVVSLPDFPITNLSDVSMHAFAIPGGIDGVTLSYGEESWSVTADDSVARGGLDISSVWNEAEFNVVGDGGGSEAEFNSGSFIRVEISVGDGSDAEPACVAQGGTTGETNNLNLGTCQAGTPLYPARYPYTMEFTESLPSTPPPRLCLPPSIFEDGKCIPKGGHPQ